MDTNFLTAVEIAEILKISKALAYRLIARNDIASVRFGRTVRVRREDLELFIVNNSSVKAVMWETTSQKANNEKTHIFSNLENYKND